MSDVPHDPRPLVWVVGDAMIDETLPAAATRFAQEDPAVPVLAVGEARRVQPGGAANVAANLVAMGCRVCLFTSVPLDPDAFPTLEGLAEQHGYRLRATVTRRPGRITTKTRVTVGGRLAARIDRDPLFALDPARPPDPADEERPSALVFCDHAKGSVGSAADMTAWLAAAGRVGILDPHPARWAVYAGVTAGQLVIVPNRDEAAAMLGHPVACDTEDAIIASVRAVSAAAPWARLVHLKLGELGSVAAVPASTGRPVGAAQWYRAVTPAAVFDLQGAGDTFLAGLVAGRVVRGMFPAEAALYANAAAAVAVSRPGTAVVSSADVAAVVRPTECRPLSWELWGAAGTSTPDIALGVVARVTRLRQFGLRIGFTNGCYDLLHPGHIRLLNRAAEQCDFLVVGIDSDLRVRELKGPGRPVVVERDRAAQVAAVRGVGGVLVFHDEPAIIVALLRPDVMFKGDEYRDRPVSGAAELAGWGGELVLIPMFEGHSTTARVARVRGE